MIEIHALNDGWRRGIALWVRDRREGGIAHLQPVVFETEEPQSRHIQREPTFVLETDQAIALMDSLWHAGIRPSEASNPSETVDAHREHITTLRAHCTSMSAAQARMFDLIEKLTGPPQQKEG